MKKTILILVMSAVLFAAVGTGLTATSGDSAAVNEAKIIMDSGKDINRILKHNKMVKNTKIQKEMMKKYTEGLVKSLKNVTTAQLYAINNFIVYGTVSIRLVNTQKRADAVKAFIKKYKRAPKNWQDWNQIVAGMNKSTVSMEKKGAMDRIEAALLEKLKVKK